MKTKILIIMMVITVLTQAHLLIPKDNSGSWVWYVHPDIADAATDYSFTENLHALGRDENGNIKWLKCPAVWDIPAIEAQCKADIPGFIELNRFMVSTNCLPTCGKYPGDRPDIGGYEYIEGITAQRPWGIWNGSPLSSMVKPDHPDIDPPLGFKEKQS